MDSHHTHIPSTNTELYNEHAQTSLTGFTLDDLSSDSHYDRSMNTSVARFGDAVVIWPVVCVDHGGAAKEFRVSRPLYNNAVRPNYIYVVRGFLRYWVDWLFTIAYDYKDREHLDRMFYAVCSKRERGLID